MGANQVGTSLIKLQFKKKLGNYISFGTYLLGILKNEDYKAVFTVDGKVDCLFFFPDPSRIVLVNLIWFSTDPLG